MKIIYMTGNICKAVKLFILIFIINGCDRNRNNPWQAKIAKKSAVGIASTLTAIRAGLDACLPEGLAAEREQLTKVVASEDAREGIMAFLEKREAKFSDK